MLPLPAVPASHTPAVRPGPEGFDSVLQVEITQFGYAARSAGKDIALYMIAEARLLDAGNGQPDGAARTGLHESVARAQSSGRRPTAR